MINSISDSSSHIQLIQQQVSRQRHLQQQATAKVAQAANQNAAANTPVAQLASSTKNLGNGVLSVLLQTQQVGNTAAAGSSSAVSGGSSYQQGTFQQDFQGLVKALGSGNLTEAQQAFSTIGQLNSGTNGVSFDTLGVPSSVQKIVSQIGQQLQSGDLAGAQQIVTPTSSQATGGASGFQSSFQNLSQALQSNDLVGARQAYSDISQYNNGTNGQTYESLGVPSNFQSTLSSIGSNLQSFDIGGAQQALLSLVQTQGASATTSS